MTYLSTYIAQLSRRRDVSDAEFQTLLKFLPHVDSIVSHIDSPQRLALALAHHTATPSPNAYGLFSDVIDRLGPSEDLGRALAPYLPPAALCALVLRRYVPGLGVIVPAPPSPQLLARLIESAGPGAGLADNLVDAYVLDDALTPAWYVIRLALRVPGFAAALLDHGWVVTCPSISALERFITRFSPDPASTRALLTNPAATLADALSATRSLTSV